MKSIGMINQPKAQTLLLSTLHFLSFNRDIKISRVEPLFNSMVDLGQIRYPVIVHSNIGKGLKYYIADGQAMVTALIKGRMKETQAIIIKTNSKREIVTIIAKLNSLVTPWAIGDFVEAYAELGEDSYTSLIAHKRVSGFTYRISSDILCGCSMKDLKDGLFKANAKDADILTSNLIDVTSIMKTNTAKFMTAYIAFFRSPGVDYDHKKFICKLESHKDTFIMAHDSALIKQQFEKLYI